jgi:RHS repeat-associated protein
MLSIRHHASKLVAALLLVLGVAMPQVSQAADAFTITAPLAGRAITSCSDITMSGGTIDSVGVSSPSPANKGNVATNGNITLSGSSTIQGDATVGPGKRVTTSGTAHVTGTTSVAASAFDCKPIDLVALKTTLQSSNDNARIPQTGQHKNPLTGANHTDFVMSGTDTLTLPAGTYYFTSFVVSGSSAITVNGPVHILCSGTVSMSGTSAITGTTSYNLHLWVSGASVALSSATIKGFIYAPSASVSLASATLVGSIFANMVTMSGSSHVTRTIDDVAPRVAITSPADNSGTSDPAHVLVKGTVADDQTDVSVKVNGQPAAIASDGTWQVTLDLSGGASPVTVSAVATDAAGNIASASIHVITAPPAISLTSPLPGAFVATRTVNLSGAAGTATSLTVNGTPAAIAGGVWSIGGFDLGPDGAHALTIIGTNPAGATTITPIVTDDTTPPTITAVVTPAPNAAGWNKSAATVTFTCSDATSGIATCPAPVTVTLETASQVVSGTATDRAGNQKSAIVTVKLDTTAPSIAITAPANGTSVISPSVSVSGTVSDALSGVGGVTCNTAPATVSGGSFTCVVPLVAGQNTITATATDVAGNTASDTRLVTLATLTTVAVTPSSSSLAIGSTATLTARATYSDGTNQDVTAAATWTSSAANVASVNAGTVTAVASGSATITATSGSVSGSATITVTNPAPTLTALAIIPSSANLQVGGTLQLRAQATYSDNSTADVTAQATWTTSSSPVATVSSAGLATAVAQGNVTIGAAVASVSAMSTIAVGPSEPLPPDPSTVASVIDPTVVTTVFESTKFLYSGASPIQSGVAAGTIEKLRACVLRGTVRDQSGAALAGVAITILGHPELGSTQSRLDGMFDMAVNGGGPLTVVYKKSSYIEGQRQVATAWNAFRIAPDIALIPYDSASATIASGNAQYQVARGSIVSDARGTRRATLLFPPNTAASMVLPDGSTASLASMTVRASEYSVGPNGPMAMPAGLPPQSAYTYCVELSADEAVAAGAQSISFSNPVALYVENFLGFPVGMNMPVGWYDRVRGIWVDQENGRLVQIVAITAGRAYLDVDGDGLADDADALIGTTPAERDRLATLYAVGQKLWRVSLSHFTPFDCNISESWLASANSGVGAEQPRVDPPATATPAENCNTGCGSIVDIEDQVLREPIPVQGTPFSLMYSTRTAPGFTPGQDIDINASNDTIPNTLTGITVDVSVAGRFTTYHLPPSPNQNVKFHWDGRDPYGRIVQGPAQASVGVAYSYPTRYSIDPRLRATFADFFGTPADTSLAQSALIHQEASVRTSTLLPLGHLDSRASDVAGWNLDIHHVYDPVSLTLYEGNGTVRAARVLGPVVQTVTGGGTANDNRAINLHLSNPIAVAAAPDGSIYVSDQQFGSAGVILYRIKKDGTFEAVGGSGCCSDQDGPISQTVIRPVSMSVTGDGTLYMLDSSSRGPLVRTLSGGQVSTIAGGGQTAVSDDPIPGPAAQLNANNLTVAADGAIYVTGSSTVARISNGGLVRHLAGDPFGSGSTGDGGSARLASFGGASSSVIGPSGSLYVSDAGSIRRIAPNGIIETLAPADNGNDSGFNSSSIAVDANENLFVNTGRTITTFDVQGHARTFAGGGILSGDNVPATAAALLPVGDLTVGADGSIYFLEFKRLRRVTAPLPGLSITDILIASQDGSQAYVFDENGRHLRTVDAETGVVVYTFGYDANGKLTTVTDADGNVTSIQRTSGGTPLALVAPGGQSTTLTLGSDGYLGSTTNVAGESIALTYASGGLLKTLTDARGGLHQFTYSPDGRLIKDQDPAGGFTGLLRAGTERNFSITRTSAEGRSMSYVYSTAVNGAVSRSTTDSAGLTTISNRTAARTSTGQSPDGSSFTGSETPDPRFGLQASLTSSTTSTPGSLTLFQSSDRSVTLTNPRDPLSVGSVTEHLRINDRTYTRTYNAATRSSTLTTPAGRTAGLVIDNRNHISSVSPAGLTATGFTYDGRGLLAALQTGTRQTQFLYDGRRRLHSVTDALQRTVTFDYDNADRVTTQTLADGRQIAFTYDHNGNLTAVTPPNRSQHLFAYTPTDLKSAYTPPSVPNGGATQYAYNHDKQLTLVTRPDSSTVALGYDGAGRVGTLTIARGTYQYAHDATSGNLTSVTAPDGSLMQFAYDGSLLTDATWTGSIVGSIHRDYDNDFAVSTERVNCPTAVTLACNAVGFTYDNDKLLIGAGALALSRDAQNGLLSGSSIGTLTDAWTYNSFGEPLSHAATYGGADVFNQRYARDDTGRIAQKSETIAGVTSQYSYGYDAVGRLTDVTKDGANISHYTYDDNGNRLSRTTPAGIEAGSYDAQDRLITYNSTTYAYSAAGELQSTSDPTGTTAFTYDELGNLNHVTLANGTAIDYVIDGQNERVGKKINGTLAQRFIYAGRISPAAELDANHDVTARFVYATRRTVPDLIIKGDTTYRVITDHLGSPRLIIKVDDGSVAQRMDFDDFGNVLSDTNPGFQPFGFAGGLYDADTKLVRFGARDYDPQTGRWTAKDPVSFLGRSANLYGYVFSDPVNLVDATGLTATCTYHQATGQLVCIDDGTKKGIVDETGYSGKGTKKNDPAHQCDISEGPIPRGTYSIGTAYDTTTHGPKVLPLTPDSGNNMCSPERSGFLIHGDSSQHPGEASEGCIIMSRAVRDSIDDAGGGTLTVVEQ